MNFDTLLVHYGELSTKGNNRKVFIQALTHNVRVALKAFEGLEIKGNRDFILVTLNGVDYAPVVSRLQEVSGIQRISLIKRCGKDIEEIKATAVELIKEEKGRTFKLESKRTDKTYPLDSYGISREVADAILDNTDLEVDVHNPDIVMHVSLRQEEATLSCHDFPGSGGYPLGMNGKVTMLLSGGIDSPVAAYSLIRRGLVVDCLHFASPPYTQLAVIDKLKDLLKVLNTYQNDIRLQIVPFTKIQEAIYAHVPEPYCITIMRRMMVRIAEKVAKKNHCLAIATGESVGQVASQTLESIITINDVTNFPILRPLCVLDKVSIIETSKKIGTFDISIRPYEDCCTIFKPKKPKTKPRIDEAERYEALFDYEAMIEEAVNNLENIYISGGAEVEGRA